MTHYDLSHLDQPDTQEVIGPIQDDEALFLFSLIRCMRLRRILEIGGQSGYSARNFARATGPTGIVYTVDIVEVPKIADHHVVIHKDVRQVEPADFGAQAVDLVFFDCHDARLQMAAYFRLRQSEIINDATLLALHDTNLHPMRLFESDRQVEGGFVHQEAERQMADDFHRLGYSAISLHTTSDRHDQDLPYRHGLTILSLYKPLGRALGPIKEIRRRITLGLARRGLRDLTW
jgi:predicted O-methyltransferase YrrM